MKKRKNSGARIISLEQRKEDKSQLRRIEQIPMTFVSTIHLRLGLIVGHTTETEKLFDWMGRCRWQVLHLKTRKKASTGKNPIWDVLCIEEEHYERRLRLRINIDLYPLFPNIGELDIGELFRIQLETPSGLCHSFRNIPFHLEEDGETSEGMGNPFWGTRRNRPKQRPPYLKVVS
ncbi:hypothetical protein COY93_01260 [Candidatus Uhrbacteria bacterium CG_4_10_14_0_8_um_filter_58_22]|uniref:Uncharacterized protein n=1 Tax=Candidatus Uhrbacteria bacterium CG_4_10_14_0_8_um_filter_58_22 TaxID=1975029 RepID=A0A2M7QAI6_9BACT|nr:MAG: hypothetical protein AUJ19_03920 [Parcubacteria group bacterium CG1_02_58_44]PIY63139.1 MAG: hypothetical protein COY93_01260 [Candidatus Uhrbacteria bacterium CG_4_10_14_0_8_um_filter_58_22]